MIMEPILFTLKAYGVVIIVSFLCSVVIWGVVRILSSMETKKSVVEVPAKAAVKTAASAAPAAVTPGGIPAAHVAVIAAAAYAAFGSATTIIRIENTRRGDAWAASGRLSHQSSHNPLHR